MNLCSDDVDETVPNRKMLYQIADVIETYPEAQSRKLD